MKDILVPKGHPQPNMERVWYNGQETWVENGSAPCPGCSACEPTLHEQYEQARAAGTLPF